MWGLANKRKLKEKNKAKNLYDAFVSLIPMTKIPFSTSYVLVLKRGHTHACTETRTVGKDASKGGQLSHCHANISIITD